MPGTITDVGHRNVHLWSVGRRTREEEEDDDERREKAELMALLRPVVSISGHHATPPPPVDESYQPTRTTAGSSRDPPTPTAAGPSTLVNNTTTADDFQWTIEWTPSADVFRHHSATSPSSSRSSASDADELIGDEEMAAPWPVERHWRSGSAASRVRHSPPIASSPTPTSRNETKAELPLPAYSTSPPVPALRAKTAHPSMFPAEEDQLTASQQQQHYHHQEQPDRQDSEEIIEEIEHVFDEIDIQSFDDESPGVHHSRLKEDPDDRLELDEDNTSVFGGVQLEQLKKLLHQNSGGNNNEVAEEVDDCDGKETTSSSPTFRQDPSMAEQLLAVQPDCLPNAVQQHQYLYHPDDRPISRSPRVVHSPVLGQSESSIRRAFVFEEEEEVPEEFDDPAEASARLVAPPIQAKSRSVASFASRNTPSPDENGRRQRSLPTRITEKSVPPVKRIGVMPSSIVNRQIKAGQSLSPAAHKTNRPESPQDPKSILQTALKNIHSSEWEVKVEGIKRLEDLITANSDCVAAELHIVVLALLEEIKNLRSQVSRVAIHSTGKMFQHFGKQMEQDLDRTVPLLLSKIGDTNRFIRDDAHAALINVTEFVSPPKAIVVIVGESLTHKNATVRAEGAKLLAAIVVKLGPAKTLSGAKDVTERILPAAAHFIQDGSLEARAQAKKIFSVVIEDPIFDKAMQKYLSPSTIRNIQRTLDTLRKTKMN